ncbi:hypothetical protein [Actinomadura sp. 3N508]|uniref:hypothetical protein n=1 Tax=Actinomadura sp. 3N508 TaxID=3375153 RepID=UPI0037A996E3
MKAVTAAEAVLRMDVAELFVVDGGAPWYERPFCGDVEIVGVTDVPGACVIAQPWAFRAREAMGRVAQETISYGMYANPKSGNQGCIIEDGRTIGWDLHPGYDPDAGSTDCLENPDVWLRLDTTGSG